MNFDTARISSACVSLLFNDTVKLSGRNLHSDCTTFYSDRTAVQSDSATAVIDGANLNSDYWRMNSMGAISYLDYVPVILDSTQWYAEQVSITFDSSLLYSDYSITNSATFTF